MADPDRRKAKAAERARTFRRRQRFGIEAWTIDVPAEALQAALIDAGRVDPTTARRAEYEAAAARVLADFAGSANSITRYGRWLKKQCRTE